MPEAKQNSASEETLFVTDTNIVDPDAKPRIHEYLADNGRKHFYAMSYAARCEMPFAHAMRFLREKTFLVTDKAGNQIEPIRAPSDGHHGHAIAYLADDEVISRLDELTQGALIKRANSLPGGSKFKANASKSDCIAFILESNRSKAKKAKDQRRAIDDDDLEMMSDEDIMEFMPGEEEVAA